MTLKDLTRDLIDFYLDYGPYDFDVDYYEKGKTPEEVFAARMTEPKTRIEEMENLDLVIENLREQVEADPDDMDFINLYRSALSIQTEYLNSFPQDAHYSTQTKYPVVFINCSKEPFVDRIINGDKQVETRTRNTLKNLVGQRVYIAETGKGKPTVRCSAVIRDVSHVNNAKGWEYVKEYACVDDGGQYDWNPSTKIKYLYWLDNVYTVFEPFLAVEGTRHGRTYMTYQ